MYSACSMKNIIRYTRSKEDSEKESWKVEFWNSTREILKCDTGEEEYSKDESYRCLSICISLIIFVK